MNLSLRLDKKIFFILPSLLFLIFCMNNLCPSIILPLMPKIAASLHATPIELKQSIPMILGGIFFSQLTIGLYFSYFGSRTAFILLFLSLIIGGLCSAQAKNVSFFWLGEFLQGFGLGAAYPAIQALVKYHMKEHTLKVLSYIGSIPTLMFFLAPIIGSFFYSNWKHLFYIIIIMGGIMIMLSLFLQNKDRQKIKITTSGKSILSLLKKPRYVLFTLLRTASFFAFYTFLSWLPFILINDLHVNHHTFSYLFIFPTSALFLGGIFANFLKNNHCLAFFISLFLFFIAGFFLIATFYLNMVHPWTIILMCSLFCIGNNLTAVHISLAILDTVEVELSNTAMIFSSLFANLLVTLSIFFLAKITLNNGVILGYVFIFFGLITTIVLYLTHFFYTAEKNLKLQ